MTQIRKIRAGWKSGSDQHRISAAIDNELWEWLKNEPNKNRIINNGIKLMKFQKHQYVEEFIKYCKKRELN